MTAGALVTPICQQTPSIIEGEALGEVIHWRTLLEIRKVAKGLANGYLCDKGNCCDLCGEVSLMVLLNNSRGFIFFMCFCFVLLNIFSIYTDNRYVFGYLHFGLMDT
ncbi:hypothetical protein CEXT_715441 [Caerostris extrusa]|uniref:Uncharacterized protein n=1 Tax=Caerostris extrusa TaxID=172846 RepID=A0AAV4X0Y9_CAEEX|nr:hypothetical protein CEXT_715441 [Caerostris extrusa]